MAVRIETTDKLKVGDSVERNGKQYVVDEVAVWVDAADNYAYTEAVLKLDKGDNGGSSD